MSQCGSTLNCLSRSVFGMYFACWWDAREATSNNSCCLLVAYWLLNSFLPSTGIFPVVTGTLLCVSGSCERHSKLTKELHIPLRPIPKEDSSWLTFLSTGQLRDIGRHSYSSWLTFLSTGQPRDNGRHSSWLTFLSTGQPRDNGRHSSWLTFLSTGQPRDNGRHSSWLTFLSTEQLEKLADTLTLRG